MKLLIQPKQLSEDNEKRVIAQVKALADLSDQNDLEEQNDSDEE
jgi:hypothetical protein